jgi:hypothetical protein
MDLLIGENHVFTHALSPLLIADLEGLKVEIIQYGRVKGTFELAPGGPDEEIRENETTATSFDFELTKSLSATLIKGELWMKVYVANTDAGFQVDDESLDISLVKIADVI